jgi:hypothetical protein
MSKLRRQPKQWRVSRAHVVSVLIVSVDLHVGQPVSSCPMCSPPMSLSGSLRELSAAITSRRSSILKEGDTRTRLSSKSSGVGGNRRFSGPLDVWNPTVQRLYEFLQRLDQLRLGRLRVLQASAREGPVGIDGRQSGRPSLQRHAIVLTSFNRRGVTTGAVLLRRNELEPPFPGAVVSFTRQRTRVKRASIVRHGLRKLHQNICHRTPFDDPSGRHCLTAETTTVRGDQDSGKQCPFNVRGPRNSRCSLVNSRADAGPTSFSRS